MSTNLSSSLVQREYQATGGRPLYGMVGSGSSPPILLPRVIRYKASLSSGSLKTRLTPVAFGGSVYLGSAPGAMSTVPSSVMSESIRVESNARSVVVVATIPESAQVTYLLEKLISNRSALADILGISRTALYDWKAGKPVSPENSTHLNRIAFCVQRVAARHSAKLYHRYVTEPILAKTPPLAELLKGLKDEKVDPEPVLALLNKAWEMSEKRESKDSVLDQRLSSGGFPELNDDQRRANANHNDFMQGLARDEHG